MSTQLKIGDLDPGAPELRPDSRYNRDNAYITGHYSLSSDIFAVIVKTPKEGCLKYDTLVEADRLAWTLQQVPGVQTTDVADQRRAPDHRRQQRGQPQVADHRAQPGRAELRRAAGQREQPGAVQHRLLGDAGDRLPGRPQGRDAGPRGRRPASQTSPTRTATATASFLLAAGSAGIEAATNIVVRKAWTQMLLLVYAAVIVLCFITFRSWRAVVVAVVPLVITSVLCEALMVGLGIGVKVATLPVIALGVGIGVDYALYLLSVQLAQQRAGATLAEAYHRALQFTGKVVVLVGVTLAAGVVTWALSPIKFQADMGILLAFMFVWNMVGAVLLIPALSHFLLRPRAPSQESHAAPAIEPAAA